MGGIDGTEHPVTPEFDPRTAQTVASCYDIPAIDCNRKPHELRLQHYKSNTLTL